MYAHIMKSNGSLNRGPCGVPSSVPLVYLSANGAFLGYVFYVSQDIGRCASTHSTMAGLVADARLLRRGELFTVNGWRALARKLHWEFGITNLTNEAFCFKGIQAVNYVVASASTNLCCEYV